ncbi:MAG: hypothetical protein MI862_12950, partial [Desulfobacterales bacterium]|nr:hypothetical protein [Desulfobacterales bacterium]
DEVDHLEPVKPEDYNKPITAPAQTKGLSDKEVQDKTEMYSRIGDKMDRFFAFQKNKQKFKEERQKSNDNRVKQDVHYAKGERTGLQQSPHEVIKGDRDWKDQQERDKFMKEQKIEYDKEGMKKDFMDKHKKLGKRHVFNHAHNKYRDKGKSMGKDKGIDKDR